MNWKMPTRRVHWSMGSVWFSFILSRNICFYLNLFSYLSASQPQIVTRGSDGLREKVVVTSNICTCSSEGSEVCIYETEQSLCSKPPELMCVAVVGQFSMVLACVVQADCLSLNTSVPCELCCFKSLARGFISQTDISTRDRWLFFCFVLF